ncbi:MAG TPA: 50S ribosomal protein L3 N(5)-glutamine methyltransferase [Burkholderiales bacterium]|nr:50S ribosomal protein L3 N(5)-glutamine methyltransferase [Burkholderiales bacterium]
MSARTWTIGGLIREGARLFRRARLAYGHGTTRALDEAAFLTLRALGLPPDAPAAIYRRSVGPRRAQRALDLFRLRISSRKPAAYLLREAWLADLPFYVDERVIVPRSHIAALLRERLAPWLRRPSAVRAALDLGTGSGCLAVLLARAFPRARVDATDISRAALAVARINVVRHRLRGRIRLVRSDLFSALRGRKYDLIVCNPPYVTAAAMRRLPPEYRYEPPRALEGGRDGLACICKLVREAPSYLRPGGLLVVEVGAGRRRVERAFPRVPFIWPETAAGHTVFIVQREQLLQAAAPIAVAGRRG